jgi:hypothetical protein
MHRQDDADGQSGGENQRGRPVAELIEVAYDFAQLEGRPEGFDNGAPSENSERSDSLEEGQDAGADAVDDGNWRHSERIAPWVQ